MLPAARAAILRCAAAAAPDECCGILVGRPTIAAEPHVVVAAHPATNLAAAQTRRFDIAASDVARVAQGARNHGLDLIGFYHSHPRGEAYPSAADIANASAWPGYLHIIAAPNDPARLRAWLTDLPDWREQQILQGEYSWPAS